MLGVRKLVWQSGWIERGKRQNGTHSSTLQTAIIVRTRNCCQTYNSFNIAQHVKSDLTIVLCIMSTNWIIPLHSHCLGLIVSHEIGSINSVAVCVCVCFSSFSFPRFCFYASKLPEWWQMTTTAAAVVVGFPRYCFTWLILFISLFICI